MMRLVSDWRRAVRILAELVALFAITWAFEALLPDSAALAGIAPHPYWLPVLVMALAYGTEIGLVASLVATVLWLSQNSQLAQPGDYLDRLLRLSLTPLLWFLVAAVVGEVTNLRLRRARRANRERDAARTDAARLQEAYQQLADSNRAMQVRLAVDDGATGRIVALACATQLADTAPRRAAARDLVTLAARTDDFTCYRFEEDGGVRVWLRGIGAAARPDILPMPLVQRMSRHPALLSVANVDDRAMLADVGVAAVPLIGADRRVRGCLVVHKTRFATMTTQTTAELVEIGTWLPRLIDEDLRAPDASRQRLGLG